MIMPEEHLPQFSELKIEKFANYRCKMGLLTLFCIFTSKSHHLSTDLGWSISRPSIWANLRTFFSESEALTSRIQAPSAQG